VAKVHIFSLKNIAILPPFPGVQFFTKMLAKTIEILEVHVPPS
jgi:hypothetical protein